MLCEYAFNEKCELVHVDSVPNGLACNCICPCCKARMEAKNGGEIRDHHFAHYDKKDCKGYYETLMHIWAKEIIAEEKCVMNPNGIQMKFKTVEIEQRNDLNDLQPDIVGVTDTALRFWVEIAVTHKCNEQKIQKIKTNNINCLEIQISDNIKSKEELKDFLLNSDCDRYFLNFVNNCNENYNDDDIKVSLEEMYLRIKDSVILLEEICKGCVYAPNKSFVMHGGCKYFKTSFISDNKKYVVCKNKNNKCFEKQTSNYLEFLRRSNFTWC